MTNFVKGIAASMLLLACGGLSIAQSQESQDSLVIAAEKAAQHAAATTLEPHEVKMIEYRRRLMGQPGLQLYVIFFNDMGQPIDYFVTDGKCTSANKELLRSWKFVRGQTGSDDDGAVYGDFVMRAAGLDGTYGGSGDYVYCKTADGKYKQWSGRYYVSDAPIELTGKTLVIDTRGGVQSQQ
jgi:hypothetical protein